MIKRSVYIIVMTIVSPATLRAQMLNDSSRFQLHFQQTVVTQYHPVFHATYSGPNSLQREEPAQTSLTTTLFTGARTWKNAFIYFNPELAGGAGLSGATGLAGFANGETFRIGNPKPQIYVARLYLDQYIPLSKQSSYRSEAFNQLPGNIPDKYFRIVAGRFGISDFFDCNTFSHDPRTQFLNWSLMGNGAYDYSANTRGYTWGGMVELGLVNWSFRASASMVPRTANASDMDPDLRNSLAKQAEVEYRWGADGQTGALRILVYENKASMGNYNNAVSLADQTFATPDITATRKPGRTKAGVALNFEQQLTANTGVFAKASWNDGTNETWMFTEIDNSVSAGISGNCSRWKRSEDIWGIAMVSNGISKDHQKYLAAGGSGFMIGDGRLNYGHEYIAEIFYNAQVHDNHFFITPDYQFVINPAYNKDRGPVHIFALRVHTTF